jgi:hypothetical protein
MPIGPGRSGKIGFPPILTNKDAEFPIWVSEKTSYRQFVNRGNRPRNPKRRR